MFEYPSIRNRRGRALGRALGWEIGLVSAMAGTFYVGRERRTDMQAMGLLSWIVFGLIAGAVAKFLMPGRDPGGCIITILLGIAGSVVGGLIGTQLHWGTVRGFDIRSFGLAVLGSLVLLAIYRIIAGRSD